MDYDLLEYANAFMNNYGLRLLWTFLAFVALLLGFVYIFIFTVSKCIESIDIDILKTKFFLQFKKKNTIGNDIAISWLVSKSFAKYRNYILRKNCENFSSMFCSYAAIRLSGADNNAKQLINFSVQLWVNTSGWATLSNRIIENHFSQNREDIITECTEFVKDMAELLNIYLRNTYKNALVTLSREDTSMLSKELCSIVLSNKNGKTNLADSIASQLGSNVTIDDINKIIRSLV